MFLKYRHMCRKLDVGRDALTNKLDRTYIDVIF